MFNVEVMTSSNFLFIENPECDVLMKFAMRCVCMCTDVLCLDAIIQSEEAHMELCRALRASRAPSARLRLRVGKLDMSCLGVPRTVVLLEQLEQEVRMFVFVFLHEEYISRCGIVVCK